MRRIHSRTCVALMVCSMMAVPVLSAAIAAPSISEVRIDLPGADTSEYFELVGEPGESLDGLTYLVIGDGPGGSGTVEAVVALTGHSLGSDGRFLVAESTFGLGTADLVASLNFENGDNVTHALVRDSSAGLNTDLDVNNDGVFDLTPWAEWVDCVSLVHGGFGEEVYCDTVDFMEATVDGYNGAGWHTLWTSAALGTCLNDTEWSHETRDLTAFANPQLRVRWCYGIYDAGVYPHPNWMIDDVTLTPFGANSGCVATTFGPVGCTAPQATSTVAEPPVSPNRPNQYQV